MEWISTVLLRSCIFYIVLLCSYICYTVLICSWTFCLEHLLIFYSITFVHLSFLHLGSLLHSDHWKITEVLLCSTISNLLALLFLLSICVWYSLYLAHISWFSSAVFNIFTSSITGLPSNIAFSRDIKFLLPSSLPNNLLKA